MAIFKVLDNQTIVYKLRKDIAVIVASVMLLVVIFGIVIEVWAIGYF